MREHRQGTLIKGLFLIYLLALTWIILFKMQIPLSEIGKMDYRNLNLIPFRGSVIVNGKVELSEIILNVIAFIPYGVYVSMLKEDWSLLQKAAPIFATSFLYEALQYIFAIGASDITDLLGNTIGGLIGIILFSLLSKILKENTIKVISILAVIGTVCMILFMGILIIANL